MAAKGAGGRASDGPPVPPHVARVGLALPRRGRTTVWRVGRCSDAGGRALRCPDGTDVFAAAALRAVVPAVGAGSRATSQAAGLPEAADATPEIDPLSSRSWGREVEVLAARPLALRWSRVGPRDGGRGGRGAMRPRTESGAAPLRGTSEAASTVLGGCRQEPRRVEPAACCNESALRGLWARYPPT